MRLAMTLMLFVASAANVRATPAIETIVPIDIPYDRHIRYDDAARRIVVYGSQRAVFVDPVSRTTTTWDRPADLDRPSVRWERDVIGQPAPVLVVDRAATGSTSRLMRQTADGEPGELVFAPNKHRHVSAAMRGPFGNAAWISHEPNRLEVLDGRTNQHRTVYEAPVGWLDDLYTFSPDGAYLYVRTTDYHSEYAPSIPDPVSRRFARVPMRCFTRVTLALGTAHRMRCTLGAGNSSGAADGHIFAVIDRTATRAAIVRSNDRNARRGDIELVSLPDGILLATAHDVDIGERSYLATAALDDRGRLVLASANKLLHVIDVRAKTTWSQQLAVGLEGLASAARLPDGRLLAARLYPSELVAIDIDALVAGGAKPLAPVPAVAPGAGSIDRFWLAERPCPAATQLRREESIAGTRWTCVDARDRPNGPFAWIRRDRPFIVGGYRDGVPHGEWKYWSSRGQLVVAVTRAGDRITGDYTQWYGNGAVHVRSTADSGMHEELYDTGERRASARFALTAGGQRLVGEYTHWRRDGSVETRVTRNDRGDLVSLVEYPSASERRETRRSPDGSRIVRHFRDDVLHTIDRWAPRASTAKRTCVSAGVEGPCPATK